MRRPGLPVLTSLRFPAAAAIVVFHVLAGYHFSHGAWESLASGVSFFYVLSGFILFYNYVDLTDRRSFWVARLARIWPVHLVTLLLTLVVLDRYNGFGWARWPVVLPLNVLLVHAWVPYNSVSLSFNGVSWSLSVEAFFYFAFPWLLLFLKKSGPLPLLVSTFLIGLAVVTATQVWAPARAHSVEIFNPLVRVFEFTLGMAAAQGWLRERKQPAGGTAREVGALLLAVATVAGITTLLKTEAIDVSVITWLANAAGALSFAWIIWVFAHQAGAVSRFASWPGFVLLGEISFSIYMCHQILLRWIAFDRGPRYGDERLGLALLLTLLLSYALFRWVEIPARRWIMALARGWRGPAPTPSPAASHNEACSSG